jgi:hypothetical protein
MQSDNINKSLRAISIRAINITGKHNIDKINEIGNDAYQSTRKHMNDIEETALRHPSQLDNLKKLYMECDFSLKSLFLKEIEHKIQGYKGQDIKKEISDLTTLINLAEVIEKLVSIKLRCCYCSQPVFILYKNVRDPAQWTLDRIDNDIGHTNANTCISCLKCNLQRRVMSADKFTFTKKLKIKKNEETG